MAKKTRKQKQRATVRRPQAAPTAARPAPQGSATPQTAAPARILPESVLPLAGDGLEIESEPVEEPVAVGAVGAVAAMDAATDQSSRRRVQRLNPTAPIRPGRGQVSAAALFQPLDSDDAAIPFDRVPYVPRDLRRVAIMASLMVVLILIAAFVVTRINP
jgi:hypothetical protein